KLLKGGPGHWAAVLGTKAARLVKRFSASFRTRDGDGAVGSRSKPEMYGKRIGQGKDFKRPVFHGALVVFRVRKQLYYRIRDPQLGWGSRAGGGIQVCVLPGEHWSIMREPQVQILAEQLAQLLKQATLREESPARSPQRDQVLMPQGSSIR